MNAWPDAAKIWINLFWIGLPAAIFLYRDSRQLERRDLFAALDRPWCEVMAATGFFISYFSLCAAVLCWPAILLQIIFKCDLGFAFGEGGSIGLAIATLSGLGYIAYACKDAAKKQKKADNPLPSLIRPSTGRASRRRLTGPILKH